MWLEGVNETLWNSLQLYADVYTCEKRVTSGYEWTDALKNGWTSIHDDQCSGHPSKSITDETVDCIIAIICETDAIQKLIVLI